VQILNEDDLRDCFAMFAMNGLIKGFDFATFKDDPMRLARWAYDAADAMLEARKPKEDGGIATAVKRTRKAK
jgi:hypothetical protein